MMLQCVILDDYQNVALGLADWSSLAPSIEVKALHEHLFDDDAVAEALADADIVVAMRERTPFGKERLRRLPNLKLLVATGMFHPEIDFAAAAEQGIVISGTQGRLNGTAELTWALILALQRHLPQEVANLAAGGPWQTSLGGDLHGAELGIIGLGRLGQLVARIARAFDMRVTAWSRNLTRARCDEFGVQLAPSLDALLGSADIVTLHIVLSEETRGLIGHRQFGLMKPTALLVNTSRGGLVVEADLLEALRSGQIAGAAVDVFDEEPLPPDHPYRRTPGLLATPHLGFATRHSFAAHYGQAVEDIAAWRAGAPIRCLTSAGAHTPSGPGLR